jgi:hypothetical protein
MSTLIRDTWSGSHANIWVYLAQPMRRGSVAERPIKYRLPASKEVKNTTNKLNSSNESRQKKLGESQKRPKPRRAPGNTDSWLKAISLYICMCMRVESDADRTQTDAGSLNSLLHSLCLFLSLSLQHFYIRKSSHCNYSTVLSYR